MRHTSISAAFKFSRRLLADRRGQDFIEYALLGALLVVLVYGVFPTVVGGPIGHIYQRVSNVITTLTGA